MCGSYEQEGGRETWPRRARGGGKEALPGERAASEKEKAGERLLLILKSSHNGKSSKHKREGYCLLTPSRTPERALPATLFGFSYDPFILICSSDFQYV
jgi:hypothetical protein